MSTAEAESVSRVWAEVQTWPTSLQLSLAQRILDMGADSSSTRGKPVSALIGLGTGSGEPPSDDRVRDWIDEHRREKYDP